MKRLMILMLVTLVVCLYPQPLMAQGKLYGTVGAGVSFEGAGAFQAFAAADIPLYTDTMRKFSVFTRTGYQFDRRYDDKENQTAIVWQLIRKDPTNWLYVATGGGLLYEFKEGPDKQAAGIKLEFGFMPWGLFAFIVGADYLPDAGEDAEDVKYIYGGINLLP